MAINNNKNHPQFGPTAINYICRTLGLHSDSSGSSTMHTYHNEWASERQVMVAHSTRKSELISNLHFWCFDYSSGKQVVIMENEEIRDYTHLKEVVKFVKDFLYPSQKEEEDEIINDDYNFVDDDFPF